MISVIIPAFNEEKFLPRCLESLKNQKFKDFEIIVVDNNSTNKTAEIAKKFNVILVSEKNQGVAYARNKGAEIAKGEILVFTDADTIFPEDWLLKIKEAFEKDKELVAFGGCFYFYSGPISVKIASKFLLPIFLYVDKFLSNGWNLFGCNMAIKKEAFLKVGGFDVNLKINEDAEISYRLRKIGKVILDPGFKVMTSGRRFRNGLILGLITYLPSTIFRILFKKFDKFQNLPPIRDENGSFLVKFFLNFVFFIALFLILFHSAGTNMLFAKSLNKFIKIKNIIKSKNSFWFIYSK